jgi:hypothetical protein
MAGHEEDDLTPWERWERERGPSCGNLAAHLLELWQRLLTAGFTGGEYGASLVTLARLFKILSDADLLLARLAGHGSVSVGLRFDPAFALSRVNDLSGTPYESHVTTETVREVAMTWMAEGGENAPPLTAHFLLGALCNWVEGKPFTWDEYVSRVLPALAKSRTQDLFVRLHLVDPARLQTVTNTISRIADLPVKVAAPVFVRFEDRYDTSRRTKDFGPYVWVQMIHDELKVAPSGRHLATLAQGGTEPPTWRVSDPSVRRNDRFSDIVIGPADVPAGWTQPDDPENDPGHGGAAK